MTRALISATSFSFGRFHSETGSNKAARGASPPNLDSLLAVAEALPACAGSTAVERNLHTAQRVPFYANAGPESFR
jgi:hypothetical protein